MPKKSGIESPDEAFAGSDGLPRPRPVPAAFFAGSRLPNKLEAGGASLLVDENPPKVVVAGSLPAGVVEPVAGLNKGTNPVVGAGVAVGAGAGGDSGSATVEDPARGEEALGRCLSILDNGPPRTGTLSDVSAGLGPSLPRRLLESAEAASAGAEVVGISGAGDAGALVKGVNEIPEKELRGILAFSSSSSMSGRSSSLAEKLPEPGVFALLPS